MKKACVTEKCDSLLDKIVQTILPVKLVNFLNTRLIKTKYIDLNLWSFNHLASGILFFLIWYYFLPDRLILGFIINIILHAGWEIFEFVLASKGLYRELFYEYFVDIAWDTIVNIIGYVVMWLII